MESLGARLRRELSNSGCKLFPLTPGCDSNSAGGNGGGRGGDGGFGPGNNNNKPPTPTPNKPAPPATTRQTTSSSVKQSTPPTTPAAQVAPATPTAAAQAAQSSPDAAASSPSTSAAQQQQQAGPDPSTTSQAGNDQPAATAAVASVSSGATQNQADAAVASTTTDAPSASSASSDDLRLLPTTSSEIPGATGTGRSSNPTSSSAAGAAVSTDGGKMDHGSGTTTNKGPAIAGALVGVLALIIIAALLYRYRRSRVVRPVLLPFSCAKRWRPNASAPSQSPQNTMREKSSRENLLGFGAAGGARQQPAHQNSEPCSVASSNRDLMAGNRARPLTKPPLTFQLKGASRDGIRRVAIPREQRLVPLGDQPADPSSLAAGFSIPPSPPGSARNSVSSVGSMRTGDQAASRPYSTFSAGNVSVASSGVLCPVMMALPVPPIMPHSPLSTEAGSNGTWMTARTAAEQGNWPRHIAMYHDEKCP